MYVDVHWNTKAVIDSMGIGVSVFDRDMNLTIWNQKYVEIFEKPPREIYPGVPFRHLLQCEKNRGDFPGDIGRHLAELAHNLKNNETVVMEFRTRQGKVISSTHAPMPGGGFVGTHLDISAQTHAAERIEHAALHDTLTGLPNRLAFNSRMSKVFEQDDRQGDTAVLMLLDLDRFKSVNDTFGHPVGDELLAVVTDRLCGCICSSDMIARIGGDEFAIILETPTEIARDMAIGIADAILQEVHRPFTIAGNQIDIGVSVGICLIPEGQPDPERVIKDVDKALYRAKHGGRNRYEFTSAGV